MPQKILWVGLRNWQRDTGTFSAAESSNYYFAMATACTATSGNIFYRLHQRLYLVCFAPRNACLLPERAHLCLKQSRHTACSLSETRASSNRGKQRRGDDMCTATIRSRCGKPNQTKVDLRAWFAKNGYFVKSESSWKTRNIHKNKKNKFHRAAKGGRQKGIGKKVTKNEKKVTKK